LHRRDYKTQWALELQDKAGLTFEIFDSQRVLEIRQQLHVGRNPWAARRLIITSVDYVKRPDPKRALRDITWDLVVVDEAHYLSETSAQGRTYRTERSRFGTFIANQTDNLLLLTATPHNGDPQSLWSLVNLVDPTLVATRDELQSRRIAPVVVRRYKRDIRDAQGRPRFNDIAVQTIGVAFGDARERDLYDRVARYCKRRWKREPDTAVGFAMTVIKKRMISSRFALVETLEERLKSLAPEPLDLDTKRGALADYRAGAPLTEAQQAEAERQFLAAPPADAEDRAKERGEVERLLKTAKAIPAEIDSKAERFVAELQRLHDGSATGRAEKVIAFTEYRDTHTFLLEFLRRSGYDRPIATLTGSMSRAERTQAIELFAQPDTMLLLATDAASEGLNLQEQCRTIVHYELPWNPNRLEQRNGRVYRWGQRDDVLACNLAYEDTYDAHVLAVLLQKTERIRKDLGSASDVIGIMESLSWEELLMTASDAAHAEGERDAITLRIDREVDEARQRLTAWRDEELGGTETFGAKDAAAVEARRRLGAERRIGPRERRRLVEWMLHEFGGRVTPNPDGTLALDVPQALRRDRDSRIPAAAFALADVPGSRKDVAILGMFHPLLAACGAAARGALYDPHSPLARARVAAKIADVPGAGIAFTFVTRFVRGDGSTFAEELDAAFVTLTGAVSRDAGADAELVAAEPLALALANDHPALGTLRSALAAADLAAAREEVMRRAIERAASFARDEQRRSDGMLADLRAYERSKRAWLEAQLQLPVTNLVLEIDDTLARRAKLERDLYERQRRRLAQELETLEAKVAQRRERFTRRAHVGVNPQLELVGALLIVPASAVGA